MAQILMQIAHLFNKLAPARTEKIKTDVREMGFAYEDCGLK
jgi:hypothetical protein